MSTTITKTMSEPYKPTQAVIIYRRFNEAYLESHQLHTQGGEVVWGEAMPFQKEQLGDLAQALGDQAFSAMKFNGIMPNNLLFFQQTFSSALLIWWCPPGKKKLFFSPKLKMQNTLYNLPGLVFVADRNGLDVYAVKGNKKPDAKTKLWRAPFHNTGSHGDVCLGSVGDRKAKNEVNAEIARNERQFFNSRFTHGESNVAKGFNQNLVLKAAISAKFNEKALAPSYYKTLESLIKRHQK